MVQAPVAPGAVQTQNTETVPAAYEIEMTIDQWGATRERGDSTGRLWARGTSGLTVVWFLGTLAEGSAEEGVEGNEVALWMFMGSSAQA